MAENFMILLQLYLFWALNVRELSGKNHRRGEKAKMLSEGELVIDNTFEMVPKNNKCNTRIKVLTLLVTMLI